MSEQQELKPCPFCGSHNLNQAKSGATYCDNCGARGPDADLDQTWNTRTRTPDPDLLGLIKDLAEGIEHLTLVLKDPVPFMSIECQSCTKARITLDRAKALLAAPGSVGTGEG